VIGIRIAAVVEGEGEVAAVPVLVRRIGIEMCGGTYLTVSKPARLSRSKMARSDDINRIVRIQAAEVTGPGGVLVLLDADDDCPVECASAIKGCCASVVKCPVEIVVAKREFEAWFLAGIESLRGHRAVRPGASCDVDPEGRRGAKELLEQCMTEKYRPIRHQPSFAERLDLDMAGSRSRSLRQLILAVKRLVGDGG
jgi:hypothetical protein